MLKTAALQHQPERKRSKLSNSQIKPDIKNPQCNRKIDNEEIKKMSQEKLELSFLSGLISLNKNFFNPNTIRMPKYLTSRFFNVSEQKNKSKVYITCFENLLSRYKTEANFPVPESFHFHLNKVLDVDKDYFCSTLKLCSPWPNKKTLKHVDNYERKKEESKVYCSLGVVYRNDPEARLVVQESEKWFGYYPYVFGSHATILFPPITKDEIWTIGFVQGVTKSKIEIIHSEGIRLVKEKRTLFQKFT